MLCLNMLKHAFFLVLVTWILLFGTTLTSSCLRSREFNDTERADSSKLTRFLQTDTFTQLKTNSVKSNKYICVWMNEFKLLSEILISDTLCFIFFRVNPWEWTHDPQVSDLVSIVCLYSFFFTEILFCDEGCEWTLYINDANTESYESWKFCMYRNSIKLLNTFGLLFFFVCKTMTIHVRSLLKSTWNTA